jgi:hypothetical protein
MNQYCQIKIDAIGRKVKSVKEFTPDAATFSAYNKATAALKDECVTIGSMCRYEPIGFADSATYGYVAKWKNISPTEYSGLAGVIVSSDFREGSVFLVRFK